MALTLRIVLCFVVSSGRAALMCREGLPPSAAVTNYHHRVYIAVSFPSISAIVVSGRRIKRDLLHRPCSHGAHVVLHVRVTISRQNGIALRKAIGPRVNDFTITLVMEPRESKPRRPETALEKVFSKNSQPWKVVRHWDS